MTNEIEIKRRITEKARELFFRSGFSKVTMDELAGELAMSKKTLYKYFSGKDQLLWEIYETTTNEYRMHCDTIYGDASKSYTARLREVLILGSTLWSQISAVFLNDIRLHAPSLWRALNAFKRDSIRGSFGHFFDEGVEKGIFRDDIERQLILVIYTHVIQRVLNPDVMAEMAYSPLQTFDALMAIIYEGILTDGGKAAMREERRRTDGAPNNC